MIYEVPLQLDVPFYLQETTLDGRSYLLEFRWNERESAWYLNIYTDLGSLISAGNKLCLDWPVARLSNHIDMYPGFIIPMDNTGSKAEPTFSSLGRSVKLYYFDGEEVSE